MAKIKYISELITPQTISTWNSGQKYLIRSGTGSGKSYFVKNTLYDYCISNNKKMLLLSNRDILKNQNEEDLGEEKMKTIKPQNYQYFEALVLNYDANLNELIDKYDFIVFDEFHYVHLDSQFNRNSDTMLEIIRNPSIDKILLILTATPDILLKYYSFPKENIYNISTNYDYINKLFFYSKEQTPEAIVQNMPEDEKAIYFGDASQGFALRNKFEDSVFICAKGNEKYYNPSEMIPVVKEIAEKSMFSARLLCTTKVLDNGINLLDADIKTIIIDTLNPITLIQELGRRRVLNDDEKVNVYIKNQHRGIINFNLMDYRNGINKQMEDLANFENLSREDFIKKYRKKSYSDIIDNDFQINIAKKQNLLYLKDMYEQLMKEKDSYKRMISRMLGKESSEAGNADMEIEKNTMITFLDGLVGKKMYKEEQDRFRQSFFNMIFSPKNTNYRHRGIRSITAVLEEDNIPFRISSGQDRKGNNPKKKETFWIVYKT